MFCTEGSPNGIGSIADAVPLDQFPRHRRASFGHEDALATSSTRSQHSQTLAVRSEYERKGQMGLMVHAFTNVTG